MIVLNKLPPIFEEIVKAFPDVISHRPIFCWGDTILNPFGIPITPALVAHEKVHSKQQGELIEDWWRRYIADPQFRLDQEIPAHVAEAWVLARGVKPAERREVATYVARKLANRLYRYGGLMPLHKAETLLRKQLAA